MLIKKCLLSILFIILIILNSFYIYNEFNIYLKKENYKFRYFAHPKYDNIWRKKGARFGFNSEFGRSTIIIDISNKNVSSVKTVLTTKDGWGSAPDVTGNSNKDYAKLYPNENPIIKFRIDLVKKQNISVNMELEDTLEDYDRIYISEKIKVSLEYYKNLRMYKEKPFIDQAQIIFHDVSNSIEEKERFNQERIKMDIENLTGLSIEEIDNISNEIIKTFNEIYKNVLYQATILKIIKLIIIIILQIILYNYLKYKLLKVKHNYN